MQQQAFHDSHCGLSFQYDHLACLERIYERKKLWVKCVTPRPDLPISTCSLASHCCLSADLPQNVLLFHFGPVAKTGLQTVAVPVALQFFSTPRAAGSQQAQRPACQNGVLWLLLKPGSCVRPCCGPRHAQVTVSRRAFWLQGSTGQRSTQ